MLWFLFLVFVLVVVLFFLFLILFCFLFLFLLWFLFLFFILFSILFSLLSLFYSFLFFVLFFFFFFLSFKVAFARSVSHRPGLSITPGGNYRLDNIFRPNRKENCHSFSRMLRFNLLILLGGCHNICLWSTEFATNCLAICHHSLALGSSHIQIFKKSDKCKTIAFSSFETSMENSCSDKQPRSHLQPLATTCNHLQPLAATCSHLQPLAATCSHLQPLAASCPSSHLQPLAATCSYLQPLAATCPSSHLQPLAPQPQAATSSHKQPQAATSSHKQPLAATCPSSHLQPPAATCSHLQPLAATCSHLQPLAATCSHLQPLAATCSHLQPLAATGKWLQVAAFLKIKLRTSCAHNVLKSLHLFFGFGAGIRFWSRFWRGEASVLPTWFYWLLQAGACKLHWGGCVKVAIAHVVPWCSMVYCNSLLANPIEVAASILLWVAAANVILFPAACKSHWGGCVTAALCCYCVQ